VLLAVVVIFDGQKINSALVWITVTVKEQLVEWPHESLAVQVTVVTPWKKHVPLGGLQLRLGGLHPPLAVLL